MPFDDRNERVESLRAEREALHTAVGILAGMIASSCRSDRDYVLRTLRTHADEWEAVAAGQQADHTTQAEIMARAYRMAHDRLAGEMAVLGRLPWIEESPPLKRAG